MIGKIIKGKSFKGCISYIMDKKEAKLLYGEGVLFANKESIINSFYIQSLMNPKLTKSVGHIPLSYSKEDTGRMTDQFMVQLAREYMKAMKIENTQYIIVRHNDTGHPHCHIIFNRVDNNGKTISDKNDHYRNEKIIKDIKNKYNLHFGEGKIKVNRNKLKGADKVKYEIYNAIKTALPKSDGWQSFEQLLKQQGIAIAYKYKGQTNEIQGISFKKGDYSFKGSEIDRNFSYSKLNSLLNKNSHLHAEIQPQLSSPDQHQQQAQSNNHDTGSLISITGGSSVGHGTDYEEEQFAKRMKYEDKKRRRKKGRSW